MPFSFHDFPDPYDDITAEYVGNFIVVCQSNFNKEESLIIVFDDKRIEIRRLFVEYHIGSIYSLTDESIVCVCTRRAKNSVLLYDLGKNICFITDDIFLPGRSGSYLRR